MRKMKMMFIAILAMSISYLAFAGNETKTESFKVYGNCGMCKARIEKAVTFDGVKKAEWNINSKILTLTYDTAKVMRMDVHKKIAAVGHDTEKAKADDKVYNSLPGCCQYERKK